MNFQILEISEEVDTKQRRSAQRSGTKLQGGGRKLNVGTEEGCRKRFQPDFPSTLSVADL